MGRFSLIYPVCINTIKPKYSVISVGEDNKYGHPNKEVLNNLGNSKIYRTDYNGSIKVKFGTEIKIIRDK